MSTLRRPAGWPLALSLAAHAVLALLWWRAVPAPPRVAPAPAMVWLRLSPGPAAAPMPAAAPPARATALTRSARPPKRLQAPTPPAESSPGVAAAKAERAAEKTAYVDPAAAPAPAAPSAVTGVAFGPPRLGLPFGASARPTWTPRAAAATPAGPPTMAGPPPQAQPTVLRQRSLDGIARQVGDWPVPEHLAAARCHVWTGADDDGETGPQCDPPSLVNALAQRLATLREAWVAYRRLAPEAPPSIEVTITNGHFALLAPAQLVTGTSE